MTHCAWCGGDVPYVLIGEDLVRKDSRIVNHYIQGRWLIHVDVGAYE